MIFSGDGEINVNSPTFGDSWIAGSTNNISWGSTNVSGNIGIELYKDDIYYNRISNSSANDGSYSWNIPIDIPSGDNYQVAVYSLNDLSLGDFSEYFSISSSSVNSITVSSPDGGESWVLGSTQDITWSSTNVSGYIGIQLYSGDSYVNSISSSSANDGVFSWNIPSTLTPGDDYRVRIYSTSDSDIQDYSNSYFSITSSQGGDPPNDDCNIPHSTTGTTFTYVNPEQNIYNFGDTYTAGLYSSLYSVGQQGGAVLRLNGNTVYDFGSWLVFNSDGSYDFTLPAQSSEIVPSNCYTMVIIGYNLQDEYVSEPFTIY